MPEIPVRRVPPAEARERMIAAGLPADFADEIIAPSGPVTKCGSCGSPDLEPVLDLGAQPLPQARPAGAGWARYPLNLVRCRRCLLVQLGYIVPQAEVFPAGYPYATGNTKALRDHFAWLALEISEHAGYGDLIADIGANDGTLLTAIRAMDPGYRLVGIEPTDQARKIRAAGFDVVQDYFTADIGRRLREAIGPARVIAVANTFGHVPDPHDFLNGVSQLLAHDGTLIIDNQDWLNIVNGLQIDTIYHEHLRYYSPASLAFLLEQHGLIITSLTRLAMHGGSFRAIAVRQEDNLQGRVSQLVHQLTGLLEEAAQAGDIYAVGAPTRATSLVNYAGLGRYLACACEIAGSEKIGGCIPGTDVPVVDEERLLADQPPHALLLAWDLADHLIPLLRKRGYQGRFIIPLPEPRILGIADA